MRNLLLGLVFGVFVAALLMGKSSQAQQTQTPRLQKQMSGRRLRSAWYPSKCLVESDHRDIDVSLAFGDSILCLELSALGIQK
jgi:hypothetical protein